MVELMGIQEMVSKYTSQIKDIKETLDAGYYDYNERNIFGVGAQQENATRMNSAEAIALRDNLRAIPLREFLSKSGTAGIQGAAYLIPDKVFQTLYDSAVTTDICGQAGPMIGPDGIPGASLKLNVQIDDVYNPKEFSSGGSLPYDAMQFVQATLTPKSFGMRIGITNDLIEDSAYDVMEVHLRNAGREMGEFATNLMCTELKTPADGDGTVNSGTTGDAGITKLSGATTFDVEDAVAANAADGFDSNTAICSKNTMWNSLISSLPSYAEPLQAEFYRAGAISDVMGLHFLYTNCSIINNSKLFTQNNTIILDNRYSHVTGRKRWLRIENYADPVKDLVGAVVSSRQDTVTLYKDAICVMTET